MHKTSDCSYNVHTRNKQELCSVEGIHSLQFAHAHKTQCVTTTHVGTLNILEHYIPFMYLYILICHCIGHLFIHYC